MLHLLKTNLVQMVFSFSTQLSKFFGLPSETVECTFQDEELENSFLLLASQMNNVAVDMYEWGKYEIAKDLFIQSIQVFLNPTESTVKHLSCNFKLETDMIKKKHKSQTTIADIGLYSSPRSKYNTSLLPDAMRLPQDNSYFSKTKYYKEECRCAVMFNMCLTYLKLNLIEDARKTFNKILTFTVSPTLDFLINSVHGCFYYNDNDLENALSFFINASIKGMSITQKCTKDEKAQIDRQLGIVSNNIGRVYYATGQYNQATKECLQQLSMLRSSFGNDNINICVTLYNLGLIHQAQDKFDEASEFYDSFRKHPSVTTKGDLSTRDMVTTLLNTLQLDFGLENKEFNNLLRKTQKLRDELGYENTLIPDLLNEVGQALLYNSLTHFALPFFYEELRIIQYTYGYESSSLASTLYYIGKTYQVRCEPAEAIIYFEKSLTFLTETNKKGKIYGFTMYEIALINHSNGKYLTATEQFKEAVDVLLLTLGEDNSDIADILQNIGATMFEHENFDESFSYLSQALMVYRMVYGNNHVKVAETLYQIGTVLERKGEKVEALNCYNQSLQIQKIIIQKTAILTVRTLYNIAELNRTVGEINKSIFALHEILNIVREMLGDYHIAVATLSNLIGSLCIEKGMTQDGLSCYRTSQSILQLKPSNQKSVDEDFEIEVISLFGIFFFPPAASAA